MIKNKWKRKELWLESETLDKLSEMASREGRSLKDFCERILYFVGNGSYITRSDGRIEIPSPGNYTTWIHEDMTYKVRSIPGWDSKDWDIEEKINDEVGKTAPLLGYVSQLMEETPNHRMPNGRKLTDEDINLAQEVVSMANQGIIHPAVSHITTPNHVKFSDKIVIDDMELLNSEKKMKIARGLAIIEEVKNKKKIKKNGGKNEKIAD